MPEVNLIKQYECVIWNCLGMNVERVYDANEMPQYLRSFALANPAMVRFR